MEPYQITIFQARFKNGTVITRKDHRYFTHGWLIKWDDPSTGQPVIQTGFSNGYEQGRKAAIGKIPKIKSRFKFLDRANELKRIEELNVSIDIVTAEMVG